MASPSPNDDRRGGSAALLPALCRRWDAHLHWLGQRRDGGTFRRRQRWRKLARRLAKPDDGIEARSSLRDREQGSERREGSEPDERANKPQKERMQSKGGGGTCPLVTCPFPQGKTAKTRDARASVSAFSQGAEAFKIELHEVVAAASSNEWYQQLDQILRSPSIVRPS